jgi:hypothetical protein
MKDAGNKLTGSKGSADCYVKVHISNEELLVERSNQLLNLSHAQIQYSRRFVVRMVGRPTDTSQTLMQGYHINAGQARYQNIHH